MSTMKMSWGARIAILYLGFVALIAILVTNSMRQDFDLVSPDYYQKELKYQDVIDASKNQAALSAPVQIQATEAVVSLQFPAEFKDKIVAGTVQFYSPVNAALDKSFDISMAGNSMNIERTLLHSAAYKVKINWQCEGKDYYQESEINLQ